MTAGTDSWKWTETGPTFTTSDADTYRNIYLRKDTLGLVTDLALTPDSTNFYNPSFAPAVDRLLVVWEAASTNRDIYGEFVDYDH